MDADEVARRNIPPNQSARVPTPASEVRPRQPWRAYGIGALLAYGICAFSGAMFSNRLSSMLQLGLFTGAFLFIFAGPIHWLFQFIAHSIFAAANGPKGRIELLLLNAPAALLLVVLLIGSLIPRTAASLRREFQKHVGSPLASSVEVKGYLMNRGLNEGSYSFVIRASSNDLANLISTGGYTQDVSRVSQRGDGRYPEIAQEICGSQVFDGPFTFHELNTTRGISHDMKMFIVASNGVDAIFIESFY